MLGGRNHKIEIAIGPNFADQRSPGCSFVLYAEIVGETRLVMKIPEIGTAAETMGRRDKSSLGMMMHVETERAKVDFGNSFGHRGRTALLPWTSPV